MENEDITKFLVSVTGQVEYVRFAGGIFDEILYVRYDLVAGPDWELLSGLSGAVSQMSTPGEDPEMATFNLPIEVVYSSTNISGWPQLVLSVYGVSGWNIEGVRGYGRTFVPTTVGQHCKDLSLVRPKSSTVLGEWVTWLTGRSPELVDPKHLAAGKDTYLIRTVSYGSVRVRLQVLTKDLHNLGYDNQPSRAIST